MVSIQIPHGPASGGLQAGSVFSRIAERIYAKHLYQDLASAKDSTSIIIPEVKNGDLREASYVLQNLNIQSNSSSIPKSKYSYLGQSELHNDLCRTEANKYGKEFST